MKGGTFHIVTLGCKINQHESQAIAESWAGEGREQAESSESATTLVVNTCAVTARAVSDSRAMVRRLARANPGAEIVVTGCAAEVFAAEFADLPGVVRVVGQQSKRELVRGREFEISRYPRARAVLRVQDGCDHGCAFCIVPSTRGPGVSREPGAVLAEARRLLEAGYRELIVSGVNLRLYGRDLAEDINFWDLLAFLEDGLAQWRGKARLRLSSLDPGQFTGRLGEQGLAVLASLTEARLVCAQLHLSIQSGDAPVLRRMGRGHYTPETIADFVARLSGFWPRFGLGADLLVGFPGEDAASFERTYAFIKQLPLTYAHVFPFSPRPGTRAADMDRQVDPAESKARAARLRGLAARRKRAFAERLLRADRVEVVVQDEQGRGVSAEYVSCRVVQGASGLRSAGLGVPGLGSSRAGGSTARKANDNGPVQETRAPASLVRRLVAAKPLRLDKGVLVCEMLEVLS